MKSFIIAILILLSLNIYAQIGGVPGGTTGVSAPTFPTATHQNTKETPSEKRANRIERTITIVIPSLIAAGILAYFIVNYKRKKFNNQSISSDLDIDLHMKLQKLNQYYSEGLISKEDFEKTKLDLLKRV